MTRIIRIDLENNAVGIIPYEVALTTIINNKMKIIRCGEWRDGNWEKMVGRERGGSHRRDTIIFSEYIPRFLCCLLIFMKGYSLNLVYMHKYSSIYISEYLIYQVSALLPVRSRHHFITKFQGRHSREFDESSRHHFVMKN